MNNGALCRIHGGRLHQRAPTVRAASVQILSAAVNPPLLLKTETAILYLFTLNFTMIEAA
jgi:hypothetical protein